MFYLGIDQHRKQLTISLRDEAGEVIQRRQVSTQWPKVRQFFSQLRQQAQAEDGFLAIVEVCGFNDWLLALLQEYGCREIVLLQPESRGKKKTDRRDAGKLSELLWINRHRLLQGRPVEFRRVRIPSPQIAADRQLTALRKRLTDLRTRTINKVQRILLKHNRQQECPTKGIQTQRARRWLAELALPEIDRLEMDLLLAQWRLWEEQLTAVDRRIQSRREADEAASVVATIPGASTYASLALSCRIGPIEDFPRAESLANYWGLTPGCRNSGETERIGSITKEGSALARYLLAQMVLHVLRKDAWMRAWYGRIKRRRGSKIARVAVMRRLATIIWHMLRHRTPYCGGGPRAVQQMRKTQRALRGAAA